MILFCSILFSACERKLTEENYVDVQEPEALKNYNVEINEENAGTTIVAHYPCLKYRVDYPDNCSAKIEISHNTRKDTIYIRKTGYIPIPNDDTEIGLKMLLFNKSEDSGTGSLAGRAGVPLDSMEWKVKLDMQPTKLQVDARINSQNKYELFWTKPVAYYGAPSYYEVRQYDEDKIITTDTLAVLDTLKHNIYYTVKAFYENEYMNTWEGEMLFNMSTRITAAELSNEQLQISWTHAYNAVYDLYLGDSLIASNLSDTSFIAKNIAFGAETIIKVAAKFGTAAESSFATYRRGIELDQCATDLFEYGAADNVVYAAGEQFLYCYQLPDMKRLAENSGVENYSAIRASADASKILGVSGKTCDIFVKKNLTRERVVNLQKATEAAKVAMSDDQIIYLLALYPDRLHCEKYNPASGTPFLTSFELEVPQDKLNTEMDISVNGKYIFVYDRVFQRWDYYVESDEGYTTLHNESTVYEKFCFNPNNEEELFAQRERFIEVLNCADLSVKKEIPIPAGKLCNIDPKTGNFLCETEDQLLILNGDGALLKAVDFKRSNSLNQPILIGATLFYERYFLDISKYL